MIWKITTSDGFKRRRYSNETMRKLRAYLDLKGLKSATEGYNEVLDRLEIFISDKRLRTEEEIIKDRLEKEIF